MQGLFITFEGIDGAGKSTQIQKLAQAFREQSKQVTVTREPGGSALAEQIRTMVLNASMDPMTEALLVFAARRDHIKQIIVPTLEKGGIVLCDRFSDSTFAYQGGGREFSLTILSTLEQWVQSLEMKDEHSLVTKKLLQPDLSIWMDLPPACAIQRLSGVRSADKFESQSIDFFQRVVRAYEQRFAKDPKRFARINAAQECESVWKDIHQVICAKGWLL